MEKIIIGSYKKNAACKVKSKRVLHKSSADYYYQKLHEENESFNLDLQPVTHEP